MITSMCALARKVNLKALRNISAEAAPSKILAAMCVLHKGAFDVRRDSGVLHQFNDPGADDVGAVNAFAMAIVFSRCGDRTLRGLREGLHSENSAKVQLALEGIGYNSKANDVRNAALTLGGLFWRDAVSVLNDTIGDNAHLVEPALVNTHYDMSRKEFDEINRILEAHAPQVSLVRAFLIGSVPGLGATLERLAADPFVLRVGTHFQQPEHHGHPMRATVGWTLF